MTIHLKNLMSIFYSESIADTRRATAISIHKGNPLNEMSALHSLVPGSLIWPHLTSGGEAVKWPPIKVDYR